MTPQNKQARETNPPKTQGEADKKYAFDYLVFIGRFQPFHLGHHKVVATALQQARRVIVLVGSAKQPRSMRNPWSFKEREGFIQSGFQPDEQERIIVSPLLDDIYNEENWLSRVQHSVQGLTVQFPPQIGNKVLNIG